MGILGRVKNSLRLHFFKREWRRVNSHNQTTVQNIFPIEKVVVGRFSYGPLKVLTWGADEEKLLIGDLVSIASGVIFLLGGNHRTDTIFTFPIRVKFCGYPREAVSKGPIVVEDDVWIGLNSIILSGSYIGKGSVIGAGSVVSGSIPPYSVAVGNPCRVVKKRFSDFVIKKLSDFQLKQLSNAVLREKREILYNSVNEDNIDQIIAELTRDETVAFRHEI